MVAKINTIFDSNHMSEISKIGWAQKTAEQKKQKIAAMNKARIKKMKKNKKIIDNFDSFIKAINLE